MSSAVCAAMRDRRLLSARGHPDRLRDRSRETGTRKKKRAERKEKEPRASLVSTRRTEQARKEHEQKEHLYSSCQLAHK